VIAGGIAAVAIGALVLSTQNGSGTQRIEVRP
jgi:hypothetical protein